MLVPASARWRGGRRRLISTQGVTRNLRRRARRRAAEGRVRRDVEEGQALAAVERRARDRILDEREEVALLGWEVPGEAGAASVVLDDGCEVDRARWREVDLRGSRRVRAVN